MDCTGAGVGVILTGEDGSRGAAGAAAGGGLMLTGGGLATGGGEEGGGLGVATAATPMVCTAGNQICPLTALMESCAGVQQFVLGLGRLGWGGLLWPG